MLFIVEILFFFMGLYALFTAKLPSWFVGKGFIAEGSPVRVLGVVMAAPLPLAFCAGLTLGLIDPELVTYASILEIILIVGAALIAVVTLRNIRKPEQPPQQ
jgi:uncharacterized membrane protein